MHYKVKVLFLIPMLRNAKCLHEIVINMFEWIETNKFLALDIATNGTETFPEKNFFFFLLIKTDTLILLRRVQR